MAENIIVEAPSPKQRLRVTSGPIPEPQPRGFILKTHFTGICHTDVHITENKMRLGDDKVVGMEHVNPNFTWPFIMGHEFCGEVYKLGSEPVPGTEHLKVGDRVCVFSYIGCEQCGFCAGGKSTRCDKSLCTDYGIGISGGYQAYFSVTSKQHAVPIPEGLSSDVASLLGCSGVTAYNAVKAALSAVEFAMKFTGRASVMIIGAGGLGLWALGLSKAMCPAGTKVFVADVGEDKLQQATANGATDTVLWPKEVTDDEAVELAVSKVGKVDAVMDFVGIGSTNYRGYQCLMKGGTIVNIGIAGGTSKLPLLDVALGVKRVEGVYVGDKADLENVIRIVNEKKVIPPPIHHVTPEQAADALIALKEGKVNGRNVIKWI